MGVVQLYARPIGSLYSVFEIAAQYGNRGDLDKISVAGCAQAPDPAGTIEINW